MASENIYFRRFYRVEYLTRTFRRVHTVEVRTWVLNLFVLVRLGWVPNKNCSGRYTTSCHAVSTQVCVFFRLNRSFYPSTPSTHSSVRADSSSYCREDTSSVVTKPRHRDTI